jgi:hypothetical protein
MPGLRVDVTVRLLSQQWASWDPGEIEAKWII